MTPFYVIIWDINGHTIEKYDIMSYIQDCWNDAKEDNKRKLRNAKRHKKRDLKYEASLTMPTSYDKIKAFILKECQYEFWSRCQYEIVITSFPEDRQSEKIDVYDQIEMNIDVITNLFIREGSL